jgi:hypothetical protein
MSFFGGKGWGDGWGTGGGGGGCELDLTLALVGKCRWGGPVVLRLNDLFF